MGSSGFITAAVYLSCTEVDGLMFHSLLYLLFTLSFI